ncbi:MAG: hypothetical protein LJE87_01925 [Deltaproteobacteria bacterium]|nr:hypothetical protein [Deltaproteobacteria bacterium]
MAVLPGVLGCRPLRRTVQVRLGTNTLRLPGGTPIFVVSRQQFMKYPGWPGRTVIAAVAEDDSCTSRAFFNLGANMVPELNDFH